MGFREPESFATIRGEDEYEGLEARVRLSPIPLGFQLSIQRSLQSGDTEQMESALREFGDNVLVSWNVEDKDGEPLPASGEGVLMGSTTLLLKIIEGWSEAVNAAPLAVRSSSNGDLSTASASAGAARRHRS